MKYFSASRQPLCCGDVWKHVVAGCLLLCLQPFSLSAQQDQDNSTKVTGLLHSRKIALGERGVYAIQVENGTISDAPKSIEAPGLTIVFQGQNSNISVVNGVSRNQTLYYYNIIGESEGTFTIPAITVNVRGRPYSTQPVDIVVFKRKADDLTLDASKPYFLRLTTPRSELYVNQVVPLELTTFVRGQGSIYEIGIPDLKNEKMVIKPFLRNVAQGSLAIDGFEYTSAKIQGAVYAIQPGEITLNSANLRARFIDRSSRFGGGLRSLFAQTMTKTLQSNSLTFDVKPLPEEGKPPSFTGAVGNFDMKLTASPLKLQTGDPVSIDITVEGVGNFDVLDAPTFLTENPEDWRTYDARKIIEPSEKSDGVLPGKCTFTQIVIPLKETGELPPFEISFFNPETQEYVIRKTDPVPLEITADTRTVSTAASIAAAGHSSGSGLFTPPPTPNFDDILYIRTGAPHARKIQAALPQRPAYWVAQLIPLLLLLWILGIALIRFAKASGFGKKKAVAEADFTLLMTQTEDSTSARSTFYKKIEECLAAWKQQARQPLQSQPESVSSGFHALDSRCQWILYGAPGTDRDAPPSERETKEAHQILDILSHHLL